jgi:hypothetical protein
MSMLNVDDGHYAALSMWADTHSMMVAGSIFANSFR